MKIMRHLTLEVILFSVVFILSLGLVYAGQSTIDLKIAASSGVKVLEGYSGRTDKYLFAAAIEVISVKQNELKIKMLESGPLAIFSEQGVPRAQGISFVDAGEGLYKAEMPIGQEQKIIKITRAERAD